MSRAEQKDQRRSSIIDAAETLIRVTGSTDFTMQGLAERAGLSTATTYNLIGNKTTVLYILLNRSVDHLENETAIAARTLDPFERVLRHADIAVEFFASDPGFYRPLFRFLLGTPHPEHRPNFMLKAYGYWRSAVQCLDKEDLLPKGVETSDVARTLHVMFTGALDLWVHDELDAKQFKAQVRHAAALILLSLSPIHDARAISSIGKARSLIRHLYESETTPIRRSVRNRL